MRKRYPFPLVKWPFGRYTPDRWNHKDRPFRFWRRTPDSPSAIALETLISNWVAIIYKTRFQNVWFSAT